MQVSNIAEDKRIQVEGIIDAGLLPLIIANANDATIDIRNEGCWALCNTIANAPREKLSLAVRSQPVISCVAENLCRYKTLSGNLKLLTTLLESVGHILRLEPDDPHHFASTFDECGGLEMLEQLQSHPNENIYHLALEIIEAHFADKLDESSEPEKMPELLPFITGKTATKTFSFGSDTMDME